MIHSVDQICAIDSDKSSDRQGRGRYYGAMETLPFDPVEWIACDPARNIHRRWQIGTAHDLFGHIVIRTAWGRIGAAGQERTYSFTDADAALRHVRALIRRRHSAPRRIGVPYRLK